MNDAMKNAGTIPSVDGTLSFRGMRIWYRVAGARNPGSRIPLLCLHGGPGVAHDYLEPLEALAATGRSVVFYDQAGCGKSAHPHDPTRWTMDYFLAEVDAVREALDLREVHLFGQSWGGMLALQYMLGKPRGVKSLVLASATASARQWGEESTGLRAKLPAKVSRALARHETAGTTDSQEYADAMMVFYQRHVCRANPWPDCLKRSIEQMMADPEVYFTMWGPSEFCILGTLKDWDVTTRLKEIRVPTLITSGRYDEATPAIAETLQKGIRGSRWELFKRSAHAAHIEETDRYNQVLADFLEEAESVRPAIGKSRTAQRKRPARKD